VRGGGLVHIVKEAVTIEINPVSAPMTSEVDLAIRARTGEALPAIVAAW
jgi:hypothetical protein